MLKKIQNVIILSTNFKYSAVISTFSEHITIFRTLDFWQLKCQQRQTSETKNWKLFFCKFFLLILLRKATLESKVFPLNRNSLAFLLHTSKTFSNVELFSIFSHTLLELIFATKIRAMLMKQSAVLFNNCQKNIAYIMCLNT